MKNAKIKIAAYWIDCPYCEYPLEEKDTGSQLITQDGGYGANDEVECFSCHKKYKLPIGLFK